MSDLTVKAVRYYDNIGLVKPYQNVFSGYREYNEEDCDLTYNMLENQLMLDEGNLETVYQQLEFNLIPIGVSFIGN